MVGEIQKNKSNTIAEQNVININPNVGNKIKSFGDTIKGTVNQYLQDERDIFLQRTETDFKMRMNTVKEGIMKGVFEDKIDYKQALIEYKNQMQFLSKEIDTNIKDKDLKSNFANRMMEQEYIDNLDLEQASYDTHEVKLLDQYQQNSFLLSKLYYEKQNTDDPEQMAIIDKQIAEKEKFNNSFLTGNKMNSRTGISKRFTIDKIEQSKTINEQVRLNSIINGSLAKEYNTKGSLENLINKSDEQLADILNIKDQNGNLDLLRAGQLKKTLKQGQIGIQEGRYDNVDVEQMGLYKENLAKDTQIKTQEGTTYNLLQYNIENKGLTNQGIIDEFKNNSKTIHDNFERFKQTPTWQKMTTAEQQVYIDEMDSQDLTNFQYVVGALNKQTIKGNDFYNVFHELRKWNLIEPQSRHTITQILSVGYLGGENLVIKKNSINNLKYFLGTYGK
jgi:hypothetical protein